MLQGDNIIAHLAEAVRASLHHPAGIGGEQFTQSRLRAFDPTGEYRLARDERSHKQVRVRQAPTFTGELADQAT